MRSSREDLAMSAYSTLVSRDIGEVARAHNEAICFGLDPAERVPLAGLLQRIAVRHELTPGARPAIWICA
jgi:hypothetical protein